MMLKNKKEDFFSIVLITLGASLLGNILAGKGVIRAADGAVAKIKTRSKKRGKGIVRQVIEIKRIFNAASSFN